MLLDLFIESSKVFLLISTIKIKIFTSLGSWYTIAFSVIHYTVCYLKVALSLFKSSNPMI